MEQEIDPETRDLGGTGGKMNLNDGLYIGVDGCRGGWITCVIDHGELRFERFDSLSW